MAIDIFREYDLGLMTALGGTVQTDASDGVRKYMVNIADITPVVPVVLGPGQDWFHAFSLPAIGFRRIAVAPAPERYLPNFRPTETGGSIPPGTIEVATKPPIPVNFMYEVEFAADRQDHLNFLLIHQMASLPMAGFGSFLTLWSGASVVNVRSVAVVDKSDDATKKGRKLCMSYTYVIEGWLFDENACVNVPLVQTIDVQTIESTVAVS